MKKYLISLLITTLCVSSLAATTTPIGTQNSFANTDFCKQRKCNQVDKYKYFGINNIYQYKIDSLGKPFAVVIRNKANILEDVRLYYYFKDSGYEITDEIKAFLTQMSGQDLKFSKSGDAHEIYITNFKGKEIDLGRVIRLVDTKGNGFELAYSQKNMYAFDKIAIEIYFGGSEVIKNNKPVSGGFGVTMLRVFKLSSELKLPSVFEQIIEDKRWKFSCKLYSFC